MSHTTIAVLSTKLTAHEHTAVLSLFSDLSALAASAIRSVDELLEELAFVLRNAPVTLSPEATLPLDCGAVLDRHAIETLESIFSVYQADIKKHPETFPTRLYHELFWSDFQDREALETRSLWRWAEAWRATFSFGPWLRRLTPLVQRASAVHTWKLPGRPLACTSSRLFVSQPTLGYVSDKKAAWDGAPMPDTERWAVLRGGAVTLSGIQSSTPMASFGNNLRQINLACEGRLLFAASADRAEAYRAADGVSLAVSEQGPLQSLLPSDSGWAILQHPTLTRFWNLQQTFALNLQKSPSPTLQLSSAGQPKAYRLSDSEGSSSWRHLDTICLLDLQTGQELLRIATSRPILVLLSPSEEHVLLAGDHGAQLWSLESLSPRWAMAPWQEFRSGACFSSTGEHLAIATSARITVYQTASAENLATLVFQGAQKLRFVDEKTLLFSTSSAWFLWDCETDLGARGPMKSDSPESDCISPQQHRLCTTHWGAQAARICWSLPEGKQLFSIPCDSGAKCSFDETGTVLTTRGRHGEEHYDATTGERLEKSLVEGAQPRVVRIRDSIQIQDVDGYVRASFPSGGDGRPMLCREKQWLLVHERDNGDWTRIVDCTTISLPKSTDSPTISGSSQLYFSRDGESLWAKGRGDGNVLHLVSTRDGQEKLRLVEEKIVQLFAARACLLLRSGGELIARDSRDGQLLWRVESKPPKMMEQIREAGEYLLVTEGESGLCVLESKTGHCLYRLVDARLCEVLARDVVTESASGEVSLRSLADGTVRCVLPRAGRSYALSPNGRWLARRGSIQGIEVWDLSLQKQCYVLDTRAHLFWLSDDTLTTHDVETQQSGNQDKNIRSSYDVVSGTLQEEQSYWDEEIPKASPQEALTPCSVFSAEALTLGDKTLQLPSDATICVTSDGMIYVAKIEQERLSLWVVEGMLPMSPL